jgi:hypothetical protein
MGVCRDGERGHGDAERHERGAVPVSPPAGRRERDKPERFVRPENDELERIIAAFAHRAARAAHLTPVRISPGHF